MSHTTIENEPLEDKCSCEEKTSIPFLDVVCSLRNGKVVTDLYNKETDINQYLLPSSCHPKQTTKSIPFSLGLRIVRACSNPEDRDKRLRELKEQLLERQYDKKLVEYALEKARNVPRNKALKKVRHANQTQRSVLAVPYDPRLPAIGSTIAKHWRSMASMDSYLKEVFQEPPLTAYRRQKNIRSHIIRAKVARKQTIYPLRYIKGMKKCGSNCTSCPYIEEGNKVKINSTEWKIKNKFDCNSYNVIYAILCKKKCKQVYIGETRRLLNFRVADHRGYVSRQETDKATGAHFTMPGHSLADLRVTIIEQTRGKSDEYRKEREHYFIRKFDTYYNGINRQK